MLTWMEMKMRIMMSSDYIFPIIHPPDQYGSAIVDTSSNYHRENYCITGTLIRLLKHSSVVHFILVTKLAWNKGYGVLQRKMYANGVD